jgi:transposase
MGKANHYQLTDTKYEELLAALRTDKRVDVVRRAQCLLQLHKGESLAAVVEASGVERVALWRWHKAFVERGADGLHDAKKSGRPRKASAEYIIELEKTLTSDPQAAGYAFHIWTAQRLLEVMAEKTGIHLCERTMDGLLHDLGYAYRRPKVETKHLQDPEAIAVASANLETLKKGRVQESTSSSLWTKPPVRPTPTSANAG